MDDDLVVKVGYSEKPLSRVNNHAKRLGEHSVVSLFPILSVSVSDANSAKSLERYIHRRLRYWRTNKYSKEWFIARG
ncbi:MAG: GIY-YIG nuclease family protein, partial [Chloroflexi bacterium]|nr:GIY-YIG nuclease family protein [Chloroflexota bacterium]